MLMFQASERAYRQLFFVTMYSSINTCCGLYSMKWERGKGVSDSKE